MRATPRGFEPLRAEPNGFRVHLLSRSDTVSCHRWGINALPNLCCPAQFAGFPFVWQGRARCAEVAPGNGGAAKLNIRIKKRVSSTRSRATPRSFEPLRAEPNGFRIHLLSRSDTVSCHRSGMNAWSNIYCRYLRTLHPYSFAPNVGPVEKLTTSFEACSLPPRRARSRESLSPRGQSPMDSSASP